MLSDHDKIEVDFNNRRNQKYFEVGDNESNSLEDLGCN